MPFVIIEGWGLFLSTRKKLFSQKLNCHRVPVSADPEAPCVLSPGQFQQWLLFNMLCVISYLPAPGRIAPSYFLNWKNSTINHFGVFSILIKSFFFGGEDESAPIPLLSKTTLYIYICACIKNILDKCRLSNVW